MPEREQTVEPEARTAAAPAVATASLEAAGAVASGLAVTPRAVLSLQRAAGNRAATRHLTGLGRSVSNRRLARAPSPEAELAEKMAPRLDDDTQAPQVINELNGHWIQIMLFVIKLLVEKHGKRTRLEKFAPAVPRVKAALDTVLSPEAAKTGAGLEVLVPDQKAQAKGFARRREWLKAIPTRSDRRPAELDDPLSELSGIVAAIHHERESVEDTIAGTWQAPTLKVKDPKAKPLTPEEVEAMSPAEQREKFVANKLGGYMKTKAADPRDPTTYKVRTKVADDQKVRAEEVNKLVWEELGHEGDVGSINTYDNAVLTWGKGWAGLGGRLPQLMKNLPQNIKDRLMDIGVAYTDDWYALAVGEKVVLKGRDALEYIRFRTKILSEMYALGQGTAAQGLVDAQADVMFKEFEAMPAELRKLDDRLIMVIVHCCWWGHMTMGKAKELVKDQKTLADQLRAVVRWQSERGGTNSGVKEGARIVDGWQANLLNKMGRGVIAATFTERADAPGKNEKGETTDHTGKTLIQPAGFKKWIVV